MDLWDVCIGQVHDTPVECKRLSPMASFSTGALMEEARHGQTLIQKREQVKPTEQQKGFKKGLSTDLGVNGCFKQFLTPNGPKSTSCLAVRCKEPSAWGDKMVYSPNHDKLIMDNVSLAAQGCNRAAIRNIPKRSRPKS